MLLELDASGQLPAIVFHLVRAGCTRRALAVAAWLKACLARRAGRSYEELLEEQEALQEELRKARSTLEDARGGGKKLAPENEELLQVRPLRPHATTPCRCTPANVLHNSCFHGFVMSM